ncbi:MAG: hypothetical protein GX887_03470 [Firmicutes bacterium]|nr:hypothetical protein [Bacillota bacterium]
MLKDVSRIVDRSSQEGWSGSGKRRRKKDSSGKSVKPAEDKLDLSDPVRFLASFKNVDFKHQAGDDLLSFQLAGTGNRYLLLFEGGLNVINGNWQATWTVESWARNVAKHEILSQFYQAMAALVSGKKTEMEYSLQGKELADFLDDTSGPIFVMLRDLLTIVQNLLPIMPPQKKDSYSRNVGYEITASLPIPVWPLHFKRHKASAISLKWKEKRTDLQKKVY